MLDSNNGIIDRHINDCIVDWRRCLVILTDCLCRGILTWSSLGRLSSSYECLLDGVKAFCT